jgi:hypothetical protein
MIGMAKRHSLTAYERIVTAMRKRGRVDSARAFCKTCGLSPTYLSQLKARCDGNPDATIGSDEAQRMARELGAPIEELLGTPAPSIEGDEYPTRPDAVAAARALKFPQQAIDSIYLEHPAKDPGRLWWFRRIEAESSRFAEESLPAAAGLGVKRANSRRSS